MFGNILRDITDPDALYERMMRTNPQFKDFVEQNKGKSTEDIAKSYGIDIRLVNSILNGFRSR